MRIVQVSESISTNVCFCGMGCLCSSGYPGIDLYKSRKGDSWGKSVGTNITCGHRQVIRQNARPLTAVRC